VLALQVLQIGVDVADAMEYLHPAVVHRDLKSQNSGMLNVSCLYYNEMKCGRRAPSLLVWAAARFPL